jgi:hypothetical protein
VAKSAPRWQAIPAKYKDDSGISPLQVEVKSDTKTIDLKVEA